MHRNIDTINSLFFVAAIFLAMHQTAYAATISVQPSATTAKIGDQITVGVQLDTESDFINAAQATINYSNDVLQAVSVSHINSPFNFWVEEPTISDSAGTVTFMGGARKVYPARHCPSLK
ncbi:MAG: hypothetical protein UY70_C0009G0012 [Candidatus Kaiserbacteria bacterium GW2011_GWB1_52_6]|uniref:Cohesin domain-containing protein n=3 Tax=Candidatus Kaiseribacteriota TaxID=1752734 RepID=A0A0G1ZT19_9BACT|nr:MAG: hypothetical protein UY67_C0012G0011 [Candidatus Kaiserbacteria bacterium GW2011_GWA2_52_12]KKW27686.1 MAG: hypothetical protein UY70_C0009G0012 [Candidatus Kaiserbacteria bacterium GW2011_GWB1_52_6]KKW31472.1 MAG: hypothetical protein UY74_C0013G0011 [Candidatus Kaiserbacteria bacterium GW2011_GWC2_52_8b]